MSQTVKTDNRKAKVSISSWITPENKQLWQTLANRNNMTMSAFLETMINEVVHATKSKEGCFSVSRKKDSKTAIKVRLTKSSLELLDKISKNNNCSRQRLIAESIYQYLIKRPALDIGTRQKLVSATREVNKVGINLNQIARSLNRIAKEDRCRETAVVEKMIELQKLLPTLKMKINNIILHVDNCLNTYSIDNTITQDNQNN